MKKLLLSFGLLLALGAGCLPVANKAVEGKWLLSFDLPSGWAMVVPYDPDAGASPSEEVTRNDSSVYLQSTKDVITKESSGVSQIEALVLDGRRVVATEEMQDLGKGLYRDSDGSYYLVTEGGRFRFLVRHSDGNEKELEKIMKSGKIVTRFTDGPTVDAKTE